MPIRRIQVRCSTGSYSVVCGAGVLPRAQAEIAKLGRFSSTHIVSSPKVWRALGSSLKRSLVMKGTGRAENLHLIDDAESAKNLRTIETLSRSLIRSAADRKSLLIAVGGGVIGDVA